MSDSRRWRVIFWTGEGENVKQKRSHPMTESAALALYRDLAALASKRRGIGGVAVQGPNGDARHSVSFS